jgi:PIN domain nuclease of toxin-antitoxin system
LRLLLDTHIWLWVVDNPRRLGRNVLEAVKDTGNELWLSPISTWEVLTLHHKKRIELRQDPSAWVAQACAGLKEAIITHEIMIAARQLSLHEDPADRILAATAKLLGLTLVTADERLLYVDGVQTLANR